MKNGPKEAKSSIPTSVSIYTKRGLCLNFRFETLFLLRARIAAIRCLISKYYRDINDQLIKKTPNPQQVRIRIQVGFVSLFWGFLLFWFGVFGFGFFLLFGVFFFYFFLTVR